jgi:hypothetical protein
MSARTHLGATALAVLVLAGCGPLHSGERGSGVRSDNGAFIISGVDLEDGRGDVLNAMIGKVPNFRVNRPAAHPCPQISIRNATTHGSIVNPSVYVDGARSQDTCILESLPTAEVERLEVYPAGFTTRPGYGRHLYGLILVFMRTATSEGESRFNGQSGN